MLTKIRSKFQSEENKRLLGNFISLSVLQGANYILPLITFPYLVRVLGIDNFGLLAFATATIAYFNIITDYGFNLTATREISIHRESRDKIIEIFSSVMTIKLLLMLISFGLLTILVFSFQKFSQHWEIYFLTFGSVIGQVLFPIWFFQGMERMKYITYLNIVSKSIFTIAVFIFVHNEADVWIVPLLTSIGFIIVGVWSLFIIRKQFNITFKLQSLNTIKYHLIDGWHVFLSRIYVSFYTTTNTVLLGLFTNNTIVGYYSVAEKIVVALGGLFEPVNQTIYPFLAKKYKENFSHFKKLVKNIGIGFLICSTSLFLLAEIFRENILSIVSGNYNSELLLLLTILLFRVIISPFGPFFSNVLIIMQLKKDFIKVMNYTVLINLLIVPVCIYLYKDLGLAISFLAVILIHTILLLSYTTSSLRYQSNKGFPI